MILHYSLTLSDNNKFILPVIILFFIKLMFENDQSLPQEFGTPLRKKQKLTKIEYECETDYSQGRSSLSKSSGVPSTIESPRLHSTI